MKLIDSLVNLVMNERQARVYITLIKKNHSSASELHRLSGVAQNKIYGVLNFLISNGFCSKRTSGKKVTYEVINPDVSLSRFIKDKEQQLIDIKSLKDSLIKEYHISHEDKEFAEYIEVIQGKANVHNKIVELIGNAKNTILAISCPPYSMTTKKQYEEQTKVIDEFFNNGGTGRSISEINEDSPPFEFYSVTEFDMNYENDETRIVRKSPLKLYIFDDEILMTFNKSLLLKGDELCASIIKQPNVVSTFVHMFNFLWEQALPKEEWKRQNKTILEQKIVEYRKSEFGKN
jgi:sugar-specific transcriptional regulator TrmB